MQRFFEIDSLRGIAVIAMVAFHALFDLNYFAGYVFSLHSGALLALGRFAAAAFIFLVGVSLTLSYNKAKAILNKKQLFKKFLLRGIKIFCLGLLITAFTLLFFPSNAIFFGVLHCIGVSIIIAFPFIKKKYANLLLGAALIAAGFYLGSICFSFPWLLWLGLMPKGFATFDYFPLLPWFGVVLLGISTGNFLYPEGKRAFRLPGLSFNPAIRFLCFLGRNSLAIYFLHQPLLVAAVLLLI